MLFASYEEHFAIRVFQSCQLTRFGSHATAYGRKVRVKKVGFHCYDCACAFPPITAVLARKSLVVHSKFTGFHGYYCDTPTFRGRLFLRIAHLNIPECAFRMQSHMRCISYSTHCAQSLVYWEGCWLVIPTSLNS